MDGWWRITRTKARSHEGTRMRAVEELATGRWSRFNPWILFTLSTSEGIPKSLFINVLRQRV